MSYKQPFIAMPLPAFTTTATRSLLGTLPANMDQSTLTRLVHRLEAATSRLEDMAQATIDPSAPTNGVMTAPGTAMAAVSGADQPGGSANAPKQADEPLPPALDDFDSLINGDVQTFVNMSEELGGLVAEQVWRSTSSQGLESALLSVLILQ